MAKLYGLMRLGRDAELKTVGDQKVCNLSLAYNHGKKDEKGDRPTQWVDAALWGKRAESLAPFLKKGTLHLFTISDIHMEQYEDKDGYAAYKLAGMVDDVELGPKQGDSSSAAPASSGSAPARRPAAGAATAARAPAPAASTQTDMDDDIPF
jgi:single-strand DNA-binding protein